MKRIAVWQIVVVTLAVVALAVPLAAQAKKTKMYGAITYDKAKEVTLNGSIDLVERHSGPDGSTAIHLMLKADNETLEVHVAPWVYLQEEDVTFLPNEKVTVVGARTKFEGEPVILAREIKTPTKLVVLRDEAGKPVWEGAPVTVVR